MIINNFVPSEKVFENTKIGLNDNNVKSTDNFSNVLKENLDKLNDKQIEADSITNDFINGEDVEIHEMILATEEAKMSLQLAIQVRNKVVEAVKELSNIQL